jgi:inosine-uridine nucleoside N-ribohydrolase
MAIILAGHHPDIHLLGISTTSGNQTVEKTTANALKMLTVSGLEHIDVVMGQSRPLVRPQKMYFTLISLLTPKDVLKYTEPLV